MMVARTLIHHHKVETKTSIMWTNDEYVVLELDFGHGILDIFNAYTGVRCHDPEVWTKALLQRTSEHFKKKGML